jgi:hypothetical protein
MSNQRKAEFINDDVDIQSFWGGHGEISSRSGLMSKGMVCLNFF